MAVRPALSWRGVAFRSSVTVPRPHRPVPDTERPPPGTSPPPYEHEPVERPGPDPDTDGEPVEP